MTVFRFLLVATLVTSTSGFLPLGAHRGDRFAAADELEDEMERTIGDLHAFGVRGLRASYDEAAGGQGRFQAIADGINWLTAHQSEDGTWRPHELFWCHGKKKEDTAPSGKGLDFHGVGVTGMVVAAYLGAGYTHRGSSPHAQAVRKALTRLVALQDSDGCVGGRGASTYMYNHAFATLALVEAYALTGDAKLRGPAQRAIDFSALARNPGKTWRYGVRPGGNDTSLTGCMGVPLYIALRLNRAGERAGLLEPLGLDNSVFTGIRNWIDEITDAEYGRSGYVQRGTGPARTQELVDKFPGHLSESCTAITVLMRLVLPDPDQTPASLKRSDELIRKGVGLMLALKPTGSESDGSMDYYYWYYATMVMRQMGGEAWDDWDAALAPVLIAQQVKSGDICGAKGSWDPKPIWAIQEGGRIYATAIALLMLETPDRMHPLPKDRSDLVAAVDAPDLSPERRASVIRGLGLMHVPHAAAVVIPRLRDEDASVRAAAASALGHLDLAKKDVRTLAGLLDDKDMSVRLAVVRAIGAQGEKARVALAALTKCLDDPNEEFASGAALAIGAGAAPEAVEVLKPHLRAKSLALRVSAAAAILSIDATVADARTFLLEGLAAKSARVRVAAALALERAPPKEPAAHDALRKALGDSSLAVRVHVAGALHALGLAPDASIAAWISALSARDGPTRLLAMQRLEGVASPQATAALANQLFRGATTLRVQAARTLAAAGQGAVEAAPEIAWCTANGPKPLREAAVVAFDALQLTPVAAQKVLVPLFSKAKKEDRRRVDGASIALVRMGKPIVPTLLTELRMGKESVKLWILYVLRKMGSVADASVPDVAQLLRGGSAKLQGYAVKALAEMGAAAAPGVPDLERLLEAGDKKLAPLAMTALIKLASDGDAATDALGRVAGRTEKSWVGFRVQALQAMGGLGKRGARAVPVLFDTASKTTMHVRSTAIESLARLWPITEEAVTQALKSGNIKQQAAAAEVVARIGLPAKKQMKQLLKLLGGGSFLQQSPYADALASFGKPAVSGLLKLLKSKKPNVRRESARALGGIGPDAKRALKPLKKLLHDVDFSVQHQAQTSISQIEKKK